MPDVPVRMRPGVGTWIRTATADERMFAAEVSVLACNGRGPDLVRLALSLDVEAHWGERDDGLRDRLLWRARYYRRIRAVEPQPPVMLHWWARLVQRLPEGWRPAARRFVEGCRASWKGRP